MDINLLTERIGIPVESWAGNCDGISHALVESGVLREAFPYTGVTFRVARGHWIGPVSPDGHFGMRRGHLFVAHSWVQSQNLTMAVQKDPPLRTGQRLSPANVFDGTIYNPIIDPTRFAFEGVAPYIYIGEPDHYDEGGNVWREYSPPTLLPFDPDAKLIPLRLPPATEHWLHQQTAASGYPYGSYTFAVCMWMANLSLAHLGEHAEPIFRALAEAGQAPCIPMDNRRIVLGA